MRGALVRTDVAAAGCAPARREAASVADHIGRSRPGRDARQGRGREMRARQRNWGHILHQLDHVPGQISLFDRQEQHPSLIVTGNDHKGAETEVLLYLYAFALVVCIFADQWAAKQVDIDTTETIYRSDMMIAFPSRFVATLPMYRGMPDPGTHTMFVHRARASVAAHDDAGAVGKGTGKRLAFAVIVLALSCAALSGREARADLVDPGGTVTVVSPYGLKTKMDSRWRGSINGGFTGVNGDVRSFAVNLDADAQRSTGIDTITLTGMAVRGLTRTANGVSAQTANYQRGLLQYDRNISDRVYGLGYVELERAPLRGLSMRTTFGVGAGYHVFKDVSKTFDVFGGIGYTTERYAASDTQPGVTIKAPELMVGERFTYQFSERSRFEQRFVVYPSVGPFGRVRTQLELALSTAISDRLQVKMSFLNIYRSHPRANNNKMNSMLMASIGYVFGG